MRFLNRRLQRDWNDVLGTAVLSDFDLDVIRRAARRCTSLGFERRNIPFIDVDSD
jgi:hypothetical protein